MPMDTVRILEVVETTILRRGSGKSEQDPVRVITQYWDAKSGALLAEADALSPPSINTPNN